MSLGDDERRQRNSNGPIFLVINHMVEIVHAVSPVEWKKRGALKLLPRTDADEIRWVANVAIDFFILLKWIFLVTIWAIGVSHWFVVAVAIFLLVTNLHTYFWYHLWTIERGAAIPGSEFRDRRRFVNLIFALGYSMALYAYLYHRVLESDFTWPQPIAPWLSALVFSIGNSLTGFAGDLKPVSTVAHLVVSSQLVMTFIFVAMLLSNSVPRPRN